MDGDERAIALLRPLPHLVEEVVHLRREQFTLRRERDAKIRELGQSVFDDDGRAARVANARAPRE